jgi:hypothetical protein
MNYQMFLNLPNEQFKRRFGVHKLTFYQMSDALKPLWIVEPQRGPKPKLCLEEQVLITLEYWREYRTYFHIGTSWGISESTVCRIVKKIETKLLQSGKFRIQGKKFLLKAEEKPELIVMDVTETPIQRPKTKQKQFYSGKKKYHTLKCQLIINQETKAIICIFCGQGRCHDFSLFKASKIHFFPETKCLQDSGYQGIQKYHSNSYTPKKKTKNGQLSKLEKDYNRILAKERIMIEHVNRKLKIFKILSERYRNRRRRYGLRCNLLAAIYNYELTLTA